jgi:hypothetical protein
MDPRTLEAAAGGLTTSVMIRQCFGCHFTASTTEDQFRPDDAIPGLGWEACHGPGLQHVVLNTTQRDEAPGGDQLVMNPAKLSPADSVDFCGACHRTTADAQLQGLEKGGVNNVDCSLIGCKRVSAAALETCGLRAWPATIRMSK